MSYYKEYIPAESLRQFIKCYWIFECNEDVLSEDIITHNGCLNIVFTVDGSIIEHGINYTKVVPKNFIFPISSTPVKFSYGHLRCAGVCLQPWANHTFFKTSIIRKEHCTIDVGQYFDRQIVSIIDRLNFSQITDINNDTISIMDEFCQSLIKIQRLADDSFKDIVHKIIETNGDVSIDAICDALSLTKRGVELKFQKNVGTSPKFFLQKIRFHNFLRTALARQDVDLTQLALSTGYYDQSHLIRTSRKFTGLPPSRLLPLINTSNGLNKKINFNL